MKHLLIWLAATLLTLLMLLPAFFLFLWDWDIKYFGFFSKYRMRYLHWTYNVKTKGKKTF